MLLEKGILYWVTGLSGAGKTTIGSALYYALREEKDNVVILDGDVLKHFVGSGYSENERIARAKKYSSICKMLVDQGITVIICTVAMFEEIRQWNRKHIEKYVEIFLDVPLDVLQKRDKKGLYSGQKRGKVQNVTGMDVRAEFPKNPDIIIKNDGSLGIRDCVKRIMEYAIPKRDSVYRDVEYWNQYYIENSISALGNESQFARDMLSYISGEGASLIEFGCGNGRDSLFFASKKLEVTGIDVSGEAIDALNKKNIFPNARFVCEDFTGESVIFKVEHDYCYSRFTFHAITKAQEQDALRNARDTLKTGGLLFIEARSIKDDLYGMGECVGKNSYVYNDHFRRFIEKEELGAALRETGFKIISEQEGRDFAPYGNENPVLIRMIAQKEWISGSGS